MANFYYKVTFVSCCDQTAVELQIQTSQINGGLYLTQGGTYFYNGVTGDLISGQCYTYTVDTSGNVNGFNAAPPVADFSNLELGCQESFCQNCGGDCECPPGYEPLPDNSACIQINNQPATFPQEIIYAGTFQIDTSNPPGIEYFGSLNNYVWPLLTVPQSISLPGIFTPIPNSGSNPANGDTWTSINPPALMSGAHAAITSPDFARPYPSPNPLGLPVNNSFPGNTTSYPYPIYQSSIVGGVLNYGQGPEVSPVAYIPLGSSVLPGNYVANNAVWAYAPSPAITNQFNGFTACLNPEQETVYQIMMTCNNGLRIFVDDVLAVEIINGDGLSQALNLHNVFEITLQPGFHTVRMDCLNYGGGGGLTCDIFECTYAQFSSVTTLAQLESYRVFSSFWKRPRPMTITATGSDIVTINTTSQPYDLLAFFDSPGFSTTAYVIEVIDAITYRFSENIPAGSYSGKLRFIYTSNSTPARSFTCPNGYTFSTCDGYNCLQTSIVPCQEIPSLYYTFNDCCTQLPFQLNGQVLVFEYTENCNPGVCPQDMQGLIITNLYQEGPSSFAQGCFVLTSIPEPPINSLVEDWILIDSFDSVPTCVECKPVYKLSNCVLEGVPPIFVSNDLSQYVDKSIYLCPENFPSNPTPPTDPGIPFIVPNDTPQYKGVLTNCCDPTDKRYISNNLLSFPTTGSIVIPNIDSPSGGSTTCWTYQKGDIVGQTYIFANLTGAIFYENCILCNQQNPCVVYPIVEECYCYLVESVDCENTITLTLPLVIEEYDDCLTCRSQKEPKCYLLVDCADNDNTIIVNNDFEDYVGSVIQIKYCDIYWSVFESPTCLNSITVADFAEEFDTCPGAPPEPELTLKPRAITPGYKTPACTPEYTEKVNCSFANQAFDKMASIRYGINSCCEEDFDYWDVKKRLLELDEIKDNFIIK